MNINTILPNGIKILSITDPYVLPSGQKNKAYMCECHCGNVFKARALHLKRGKTNSCGCSKMYRNKKISYYIKNKDIAYLYNGIKYRCYNPNQSEEARKIYFDRNIKMSDEWLNDARTFENWCIDNGYKKGLQIDRINNEKGYSADNCRFVTQIQNARNKRKSVILEYNGIKMHLKDFIEQGYTSVGYYTIFRRLKMGWTVKKAFEYPNDKMLCHKRLYTYKDKTMHLKQFIKQGYTTIKEATIIHRIKAGWSVEDAFEIEAKISNRIYKNGAKNKMLQ